MGGSAGAAAQDVLVAHELSIVFSDRPRPRLEVRIGRIGALGPFPHVAIHLRQAPTTGGSIGWSRVVQTTLNEIPFHGNMLCCHLPLGFSWEACIRPSRFSQYSGAFHSSARTVFQPSESHRRGFS